MSTWAIAFSRDNSTNKIEIDSATKPTMEKAVAQVMKWAEANVEPEHHEDTQIDSRERATLLLKRYGITITGIAQV
ncbi:hypothetical protein IB229_18065 [Pseudomonas sp. PDM14]|uniref:hypothetical protein n=1 Tax=Pseudomonas sp. PDM14 TaxID=2769288 RepID=UPI0017862980|nr:hypothetical protein [Pseudomonas sp. PDM14]MBD9484892.1 hypothetical protein [Pseudomonas sp. PDM14]